MKTRATTAVALAAGILLGAVVTAGGNGPVGPTRAEPPASQEPSASIPELPGPSGVLLAWTPSHLPDDIESRLAANPHLGVTTVVTGGILELRSSADPTGATVDQAPPGMAYPLDAIAIAPTTFALFAQAEDAQAIELLGDDQALLSATSARLRRIGVGGSLELAGKTLIVAGIVGDVSVGGAEVAITKTTSATLELNVARYVLVRHTTSRSDAEEEIRALFPQRSAIRFRSSGETPFLREGDAVPPLAVIKTLYGEFAYRPGNGREIIQAPNWTRDNIVEADVPILGTVRCHRAIIEPLRAALRDLQQRNLASLVDPAAFAGCWNPRQITEGDNRLSRHAWGIAFDLNWGKNPTGLASVQDDRLVTTMASHGFTWGGRWLVPDPAHFEYTG